METFSYSEGTRGVPGKGQGGYNDFLKGFGHKKRKGSTQKAQKSGGENTASGGAGRKGRLYGCCRERTVKSRHLIGSAQ